MGILDRRAKQITAEIEEKQRLFQKALDEYKENLKAEIKKELKSEIMDDLEEMGLINKEKPLFD